VDATSAKALFERSTRETECPLRVTSRHHAILRPCLRCPRERTSQPPVRDHSQGDRRRNPHADGERLLQHRMPERRDEEHPEERPRTSQPISPPHCDRASVRWLTGRAQLFRDNQLEDSPPDQARAACGIRFQTTRRSPRRGLGCLRSNAAGVLGSRSAYPSANERTASEGVYGVKGNSVVRYHFAVECSCLSSRAAMLRNCSIGNLK
jgi:hypothetical protein